MHFKKRLCTTEVGRSVTQELGISLFSVQYWDLSFVVHEIHHWGELGATIQCRILALNTDSFFLCFIECKTQAVF